MDALATVEAWDVGSVAVAVVAPDGSVASNGDIDEVFRIASVTKLFTTYATLIAVEDGWSGPHPPPAPIAGVARRRIYSNAGMEVAADHVAECTSMPFEQYLREA